MSMIQKVISWMLVFSLFLLPVDAASEKTADAEAVTQAIIAGYEAMETEVDLSEFHIPKDEIKEIYCAARNGNLLPWYAEWFSYTYYPSTGNVASIVLKYYDPAVYDYNLYEQRAEEILAQTVFPGMSQWQIALSIHDYLATSFCYDETKEAKQGPDLLIYGTSVCNGYARVYMDLLKRAGLEAILVTSSDMNHGWNLVKINEDWYHVDVTWDDPVSDCHGRVRHAYFLLDDETISDEEHKHYGWETSLSAQNPNMASDTFWLDTDSAICYESNAVSYLRMDEANEHWIYRRDEFTGELTEIAYFDAGYLNIGSGSYHYGNYGLSLWDGKLYFSDMEQVYVMNTDGSEKQVIYTHDAESAGTYINGSLVRNGKLYLTFSNHERDKTHLELSLPGGAPPKQEMTPSANHSETVDLPTEILSDIAEDGTVTLPELPDRSFYVSAILCILVLLTRIGRKRP